MDQVANPRKQRVKKCYPKARWIVESWSIDRVSGKRFPDQRYPKHKLTPSDVETLTRHGVRVDPDRTCMTFVEREKLKAEGRAEGTDTITGFLKVGLSYWYGEETNVPLMEFLRHLLLAFKDDPYYTWGTPALREMLGEPPMDDIHILPEKTWWHVKPLPLQDIQERKEYLACEYARDFGIRNSGFDIAKPLPAS
jgi:hypothetical protein